MALPSMKGLKAVKNSMKFILVYFSSIYSTHSKHLFFMKIISFRFSLEGFSNLPCFTLKHTKIYQYILFL